MFGCSDQHKAQKNSGAMFVAVTSVILALCLAGCDEIPRDPRQTWARIMDAGEIKVGLIVQAPWVMEKDGKFSGIEVEIIADFATALKLRPRWKVLSEAEATEQIKNQQLDLVIGGLTADNPRKKEIGLTRPYIKLGSQEKHAHVMAVPQGENKLLITLENFLQEHLPTIQYYVDKYHETGSSI
jgi:hypothetical protein